MDSPIAKLMFIAAAVAASALVVTIMWQVLGNNAPPAAGTIDYTKITSKALCDAAGGNWTSSACAAPA